MSEPLDIGTYHGIDYSGLGATCNRDADTGIRYGIVSMNALQCFAIEHFEADYGPASCPKCGNDAVEYDEDTHTDAPRIDPETDEETEDGYEHGRGCTDYACEECRYAFDSDEAYGEEPTGWTLEDGEISGFLDSSNDVWITASPYYTHAQFCSPCAPGACHLENPVDTDGPRAFCLPHDWFPGNRAPYPVYRVADGSPVAPDPTDDNGSNDV